MPAADLVLVDPNESWVVSAQESPSTQGYTPFEGMELSARVKQTWLRRDSSARLNTNLYLFCAML